MGKKILLKQLLVWVYWAYLPILAACFFLPVWLLRWRRAIVRLNGKSLLPSPLLFFWSRLCYNASSDLLQFLHGRTLFPIQCAPKDRATLESLKGNASLLLTAHFHNWEMMGGWLVSQGVSLLSAAQPLASTWGQSLLSLARLRIRSQIVSSEVLLTSLSHLKSGGCFAFLWDQHASRSRMATPFFGHAATMNSLPFYLQRQALPAVYFAVVLPGGTFRIWQLLKAGKVIEHPGLLSRRYHRCLEKVIVHHPTYWYGFAHRRLKGILPYAGAAIVSRETTATKSLVSRETSH